MTSNKNDFITNTDTDKDNEISLLKNNIEKRFNQDDEIFSIIKEKNNFDEDIVAIVISDNQDYRAINNKYVIDTLFSNDKFKEFIDTAFDEKISFLENHYGNYCEYFINSRIFVTNLSKDSCGFKRIKYRYENGDKILLNSSEFQYFIEHIKLNNYKHIGKRKAIFFNGTNYDISWIGKFSKYMLSITNRYVPPVITDSKISFFPTTNINGNIYFQVNDNKITLFNGVRYKLIKNGFIKNKLLNYNDYKMNLYMREENSLNK